MAYPRAVLDGVIYRIHSIVFFEDGSGRAYVDPHAATHTTRNVQFMRCQFIEDGELLPANAHYPDMRAPVTPVAYYDVDGALAADIALDNIVQARLQAYWRGDRAGMRALAEDLLRAGGSAQEGTQNRSGSTQTGDAWSEQVQPERAPERALRGIRIRSK